MSERILIASVNPWSFAVATERQFAVSQAGRGTVDLLNLYHLLGRDQPGVRRRDWLIELLNRKIERFVGQAINGRDISGDINLDGMHIPRLPETVAELRAFRVDGAAVGLGALSSAAEITTIFNATLTADFGEPLERAWRISHRSLSIAQQVARFGYDRVLVFGGRHCQTRSFSDALSSSSELIYYEQGGAGDRAIFSTEPIYEPERLARLIEAQTDFSMIAGKQFFDERISRAPGSDSAFFTTNQVVGELHEELREVKPVSFFTSSPDEMFAVRDKIAFGQFTTQAKVGEALAECCEKLGMRLAIRLHPHLRFKDESWRREWDFAALRSKGAILIMPEDPCDSYELIRASHCVFTCGSTIGLESTYLGVPNAVIGVGLSESLGATSAVNDRAGIAAFIARPSLPKDGKVKALLFGSYHMQGGTKVKGLQPGSHPSYDRIDGRIVDRIRFLLEKLRHGAAALLGTEAPNRSGIVSGKVVLPSGARYD